MTVAILLLACLVLAGAVVALGVALRELRGRVQALETPAVRSPGFETGASAPSSTSGGGGAASSTSGGGGAASSTSGGGGAASSTSGGGGAASSTSGSGGAASSPDDRREYVITRLGDEPEGSPAPTLETRLFADVVLRESVVMAASLAHGVRRGLSPANRNRIWFEMRREVKRARKDRKAEEREAIREWRARQRATQGGRHAAQREDDAA